MSENANVLIFDTNFIIEHAQDLKEVVLELRKSFEVFITQLSIDERISQQYLDLKSKYDKANKEMDELASIATITINKSFEEKESSQRKYIQSNYEKLFEDHIIKFSADSETFSKIIDRVYKKIPPFLTGNKASDKGFKDTILWLSLMEYFKNHKTFKKIVFVSNDNGFIESKDLLIKEFYDYTGVNIEIYKNDYLNDILSDDEEESNNTDSISITKEELAKLREDINQSINFVCSNYYWDDFIEGKTLCVTFNILEYVTLDQVKEMMTNLSTVIKNNIFSTDLYFSDLINTDIRLKNMLPIPMDNIEELNKVYEHLKQNHKDLLLQFYNVVMNRINRNYQEPQYPEDIPF